MEVPGEHSSDSEKSSVRGESSLPPKCPLSEGSLAIILELSNSLLMQLSLSFKSDGIPAIILELSYSLLMQLSS